jgi:hypothetical protein
MTSSIDCNSGERSGKRRLYGRQVSVEKVNESEPSEYAS